MSKLILVAFLLAGCAHSSPPPKPAPASVPAQKPKPYQREYGRKVCIIRNLPNPIDPVLSAQAVVDLIEITDAGDANDN